MWIRLRQVALVARNLPPIVDQLHEVFGLEVGYRDPGVGTWGLENVVIPVGTQFLEVVAPTQEGTAGGRYLDRRHGDGGYMVITHTDDHAARRARAEALGIRTAHESDHGEFRGLQLHPADTGGSFLEIDYQEGGEDPHGPWWPAGPDWQEAARTDRVDGILGVELQVADPDTVAARWADILEIEPDSGGRRITLDNATVDFVDLADDRGDGLSGVRLAAVDPVAVERDAERLGLLADDGTIAICGMRFTVEPAGD
jgi:Glyoxalase-like domain